MDVDVSSLACLASRVFLDLQQRASLLAISQGEEARIRQAGHVQTFARNKQRKTQISALRGRQAETGSAATYSCVVCTFLFFVVRYYD